jgi:hypothetical protein
MCCEEQKKGDEDDREGKRVRVREGGTFTYTEGNEGASGAESRGLDCRHT